MNAGTRRPARKLADIFMIKLPFSNLSVIQEKLGRGNAVEALVVPIRGVVLPGLTIPIPTRPSRQTGFHIVANGRLRARLREAGPQVVALSSPTPSRAAAARGR